MLNTKKQRKKSFNMSRKKKTAKMCKMTLRYYLRVILDTVCRREIRKIDYEYDFTFQYKFILSVICSLYIEIRISFLWSSVKNFRFSHLFEILGLISPEMC